MVKESKKVKSKLKKKAKKAAAKAVAKAVIKKELVGHGDYRTRVLRGKGDYADTIGKVVGDGIGGGVSWAAKKVGGWLSGLFGMGDYSTHAELPNQNTFVSGATIPTQVHSTKDREFVYRGREEICDIYSSSDPEGVQVSYDVNPGLENFMEWLSITAPAFSEWYPNGLVFEYVPAVSPQSADANGKLAMCVSYDNGDPDPGSFKDISQYLMSVQTPPWKPAMMAGECKPKLTALNWYKVRSGDVAITDEAHSSYDWGKVHFRAGGQATTGTLIGTVFIVYEIVFQKPLAPRPVGRTLTDVWNLTTASGTAPLGTARTAREGNTLGLTFSGNTTVVMPSWVNHGKFLLNLELFGTTAVIATPTVTLTGATGLAWMPAAGTYWGVPITGVNSQYYSMDFFFEVTAASATIAIGTGTLPTSASGVLTITAVDTDVTVLNRRKNHYESYWKRREEEKLQELKYVDESVSNKFQELEDRYEKLFKWASSPIPLPQERENYLSELKSAEAVIATASRCQRLTALLYDPKSPAGFDFETIFSCFFKHLERNPSLSDSEVKTVVLLDLKFRIAAGGSSPDAPLVPPPCLRHNSSCDAECPPEKIEEDGDTCVVDREPPTESEIVKTVNFLRGLASDDPRLPNARVRSTSQPPGAR